MDSIRVNRHPIEADTSGACGFPACHRPIDSHGYCKTHARQQRDGQPLRRIAEQAPAACPPGHGERVRAFAELASLGRPLFCGGVTPPPDARPAEGP